MDPYSAIAPFFDLEHEELVEDIDFYLRHVDKGPVLDVGVGTGRVALPLSEAGLDVVGVDTSPAMLERARRRLEGRDLRLLSGSVSDVPARLSFRCVLLTLNTLWHVREAEERLALFGGIHSRLQSNGKLIVDCTNPLTMADRGAKGEVRERFRLVRGRTSVAGFSSAWDDEATQELLMSLWYDELDEEGAVRRTQTELDFAYVYRRELEVLARATGLVPTAWYGGYDEEPYSAVSSNLIMLAEKG